MTRGEGASGLSTAGQKSIRGVAIRGESERREERERPLQPKSMISVKFSCSSPAGRGSPSRIFRSALPFPFCFCPALPRASPRPRRANVLREARRLRSETKVQIIAKPDEGGKANSRAHRRPPTRPAIAIAMEHGGSQPRTAAPRAGAGQGLLDPGGGSSFPAAPLPSPVSAPALPAPHARDSP